MDYHPISTIFPLMEGEALDKLTQDIAENGLREPIVLLDGKILDGRNRYLACQKAAIKPEFTTYCGDSPLRYVLSLNLRRRHLTSSELSTVAVEALPWLEEEARKQQEATRAKPGEKIGSNVVAKLPPPTAGKSRDQAATLVGVSARQISSAKAIKKKSSGQMRLPGRRGPSTLHWQSLSASRRAQPIGPLLIPAWDAFSLDALLYIAYLLATLLFSLERITWKAASKSNPMRQVGEFPKSPNTSRCPRIPSADGSGNRPCRSFGWAA